MGCSGGVTLSRCRRSTPTTSRRLWCSTSGCCWRSSPTEVRTHTHTHFLFYLLSRPQFVFILSQRNMPSSPSLTTRGRQRPVQHFTGTCGRFMRLHHAAQPHTLPEFIFLCLASGEKTCFLLTSSCSVPVCRNITTINKQTNKQPPSHQLLCFKMLNRRSAGEPEKY